MPLPKARPDSTIEMRLKTAGAGWLDHLIRLNADRTAARTMIFLVGSCRWPGIPAEADAIEKLFEQMLAQVEHDHNQPIDGLWLVGDQIYCDALANIFETTETNERAASRYREAFSFDHRYEESYSSKAMQAMLRQVPSWFVIDDHEFDNDWDGWLPGARPSARLRARFAAAVAYQWRAAPRRPADTPTLGDAEPRGLWRQFEAATLPVFVLDTRTERQRRSYLTIGDCSIIGAAQMQALRNWLYSFAPTDRRPKFILSGSVFGYALEDEIEFPDLVLRADHWGGFPRSSRELANLLYDCPASNIVFVGGDFHLSACARIELRKAGAGRNKIVHSLVASGLNATLPFANVRADQFPKQPVRLPFSDASIEAISSIEPLSSAYRQFTRLEVRSRDPAYDWTIGVRVHDERGHCVASKQIELPAAAAD